MTRSKLEAGLLPYLVEKGYVYEAIKIHLVQTHVPDFYNEDTGTIIEVKGIADAAERSKFLRVQEWQYSQVQVVSNAVSPEIKEAIEKLKEVCRERRVSFRLYENPAPFKYIVAPQTTKSHLDLIRRARRNSMGSTTPRAAILKDKDLHTWLTHNGFISRPINYGEYDLLLSEVDKLI